MDFVIKISLTALLGVTVCLLIKRTNPELTMLLSTAVAIVILLASLSMSNGFGEFRNSIKALSGSSELYMRPMLKCLAISIITKIGSDLCKDSSNSAAAYAVEFAGTVSSMMLLMPLFMSTLKILGGII